MGHVDQEADAMFAPVFTGGRNLHRVIAVALATLFSFGVFASEPVVDETLVAAEPVALSTDSEVVVTPIPMPASVIELATTGKPGEASVSKALEAGSKQAAAEDDAIASGAPSNGALGTQAKER